MRGRLLTVEGLDGSGKATQARLLCDFLSEMEIRVRKVSFPDYEHSSSSLVKMYLNGEFGSKPEDVNAYAASSFFAVDRYASYRKYWKASLENGEWVVADRYTTSNMIYQVTKLPRDEWDPFLDWVCDFGYVKLGLPQPHLTLYLDMPPAVSQKLLAGRYHGNESKKDIHERDLPYMENCRLAALYVAKKMGWRMIHCATGQNPKAIPEVQREIRMAAETCLLQNTWV